MPRTAEHRVECHKAASALRAAGKPIWKRTVDIKAILNKTPNDKSADHHVDIAKRIAKLMRARLPAKYFDITNDECDFDFLDTIESMEESSAKSFATDLENGHDSEAMINMWLEYLYDWADKERVWLG
jgi:hypothetical protein